MLEKKLLTKKEVEEINTTGFPGMMYYVGKLEWDAGYDYWLIPGTGSRVEKIKKEEYSFSATPEYAITIRKETEMVNGPAYYGGIDNPYEVIKVCEAWGLDKDAYLFNVAKYIARAGKKDPAKELEDLKKAVFYLERRIKLLSK